MSTNVMKSVNVFIQHSGCAEIIAPTVKGLFLVKQHWFC